MGVRIKGQWPQEYRYGYFYPIVVLAIVGNKIDLMKEKEEVPYNEAKEYANKLGAIFKYTSAKENKGINVWGLVCRNCLWRSPRGSRWWGTQCRGRMIRG